MGFNPNLAALKKAKAAGTSVEEQLKKAAPKPAVSRSAASSKKAFVVNYSKQANVATKLNLPAPTAPYNFVKLNDVVVEAPLAKNSNEITEEKLYKSFLLNDEPKYSGYFELTATSLTALFIGGEGDAFFSDGKNSFIPGSSVRGAIKNYFKIITNGSMRTGDDPDVTDKLLYYRTFASPFHSLRDAYKQEMTATKLTGDGKTIDVANTEAGFLVREGKNYYICPATFKRIKDEGKAIARNNQIVWNGSTVDVFTGPMHGKKHYYQFTGAQWKKKLAIPEKIMAGYVDDKNRKGMCLLDNKMAVSGKDDLAILNGAQAYDYIIPCFYVADVANTVKHFGSGPLYRIPYRKSISQHIPKALNRTVLDFATAMFGNKDKWSSRVFFENLYLVEGQNAIFEKAALRKPLLGANPTSFQNYLETNNGVACDWNNKTNIRGYKLYWHQKTSWKQTEAIKNDKVTKKIAPVRSGVSFTGRVRFENLAAEELGALARALSLCDEADAFVEPAYKLGSGKPIGMGSVRMESKLYLQQKDYYTKLFCESGFDAGLRLTDKRTYISAFDKYMQSVLEGESRRLYAERMQELRLIMNAKTLQEKDWPQRVKYMGLEKEAVKINNNRVPLPAIDAVVRTKK